MPQMRSASAPVRTVCAVLLALLLGVRTLSPVGFMPAFDRGTITIVACPDYDAAPPMAHHHHGPKELHQHCPYAAGSAPATSLLELAPLLTLLLAGAALLLWPRFHAVGLRRSRERPPSRGPPLPA